MLQFHTGNLSELLKEKGLSEEEKKKIILTNTALILLLWQLDRKTRTTNFLKKWKDWELMYHK